MNQRLTVKVNEEVIVKSIFCDEAISIVTPGDCFGKKRLAMTIFLCFRTDNA
jgi:hypothetical protein